MQQAIVRVIAAADGTEQWFADVYQATMEDTGETVTLKQGHFLTTIGPYLNRVGVMNELNDYLGRLKDDLRDL